MKKNEFKKHIIVEEIITKHQKFDLKSVKFKQKQFFLVDTNHNGANVT
jgi:hypothetical protein